MNRILRSRIAHPSTIEALQRAQNGCFSLAEVIEEKAIPVSKGTLSRILTGGGVSLQAENAVRRALGEGPLSAHLAPCPTCHGDHGLQDIPDCHGAPVAAVVCLAPGEVVAQAKPERRKRVRPDDVTVHVSRKTLALLRSLRQADLSDNMTLYRILHEYKEMTSS